MISDEEHRSARICLVLCAGTLLLNRQSHSFSQGYGTKLPTSLTHMNLRTRGFSP